MSKAPFPVDPHLTGIAIAYRNKSLIADSVFPRVPVGKEAFKWWKFAIAEGFTIPDTNVGRRGRPNEIEFSATEVPGSTQDYALDDPIPQNDIDNAPENYDPVARAVEGLTDLILLDRERRAAALAFALATYPAAQRVTLAGNDQWSDFVNSDPIDDIQTGLDTPLIRPNVMVIGRQPYAKLTMHPKIVKATNASGADTGIAKRQAIAELFELDEIVVGESWLNTAKPGQAATYARVWGKHAALIHRDQFGGPNDRTRVSFGYTAQWRTRVAGAEPDKMVGAFGGQRARVAESVAEIVASAEAGYFIQNAIA